MLNSAGNDMASANRSVRIPLAPLTSRRTRPTLTTRTTRSSVGETKYAAIKSLSITPGKKIEEKRFFSWKKRKVTRFRVYGKKQTCNGQHDDNEIKYIPWFFKVMDSEGENFKETFSGEDCNEEQIHLLQC